MKLRFISIIQLLLILCLLGDFQVQAKDTTNTTEEEFIYNFMNYEGDILDYLENQKLIDCTGFFERFEKYSIYEKEFFINIPKKYGNNFKVIKYDTLHWLIRNQDIIYFKIDDSIQQNPITFFLLLIKTIVYINQMNFILKY